MSARPVFDLSNQRFGKLSVKGRANTKRVLWNCVCDCGREIERRAADLRSRIKSCGCGGNSSGRRPTHGMTNSSTFVIWQAMKQRCYNAKHQYYPRYGGRGIVLCERWQSFDNFLADMGPRPSNKHSIDRYPDNDGNYEPDNCRWATPKEQAANRRPRRTGYCPQ